jgi:hypothetical protein
MTKAGSGNCPPSPKPGKVNLEFTLTIRNETSGRTAPLPTVGALSNVLKDGTVAVPSPDPSNPPDGGRGWVYLQPIGFTNGPMGCYPSYEAVAGAGPLTDINGTNILKPGESKTYHGYISETPQDIPAGTSVVFSVGGSVFLSNDQNPYWVIHYGPQLPNTPTTATTTKTQLPTTTTSLARTTTTNRPASTASCNSDSITTVLTSGQWTGVDQKMASNLAVDLSATKFTSDGKWAKVATKNLPTSPGYQPPLAWFHCVGGNWTYVTYGEPPGPTCSTASEELKAAIKEITGGTCSPG